MGAASAAPVVVSAWAGSTNLGDELVLSALLRKLRHRGVEADVLSVDPAGTTRTHRTPASSTADLLRQGRSQPAGVVLGGGGLLQDETSPFNLPFHLGRTHLAAGGGRRAGVGLGVGPLGGRLGRALVRRSLGGAVATSVRDAPSQDLLRSLGVESLLAADLAVSLPRPRVEVEPRIGVSLRPWTGGRHVLPAGVRRRAPTVGAPPWFVASAAIALDAMAARTGLAVHFVALQRDRDDVLHREVAGRMRASATTAVPTVHTVVDELAACEVVIAMRYHAGIAALLGGRPAVLVGYSPKVAALAADVPGGMAGTSWDAQSLASLPATLDLVLARGEAVVEGRERLREREGRNDDVLDRLLDGPG